MRAVLYLDSLLQAGFILLTGSLKAMMRLQKPGKCLERRLTYHSVPPANGILCYLEKKQIWSLLLLSRFKDLMNLAWEGWTRTLPTFGLGKAPPVNFCLPMHRPKTEEIRQIRDKLWGLFCGSFSSVETAGDWKSMARQSSFTEGKSVLQELLMERDQWILEWVCQ